SIVGSGSASTIIDGAGADRLFHVIGPIALQLSGLTLRNGNVPRPADFNLDGGGGAVFVTGGGSLNLANVTVSGNVATSGAVTIDDGGSLTVTGSSFSGNTASFGAAIFSNGTVSLTGSTLTANSASSSGGAIYVREGTVSITNNTIASNSSGSSSLGG